MEVAYTIHDIRSFIAQWRSDGKTVGLVPTMGALHEGHASLMDAAKQRCDHVVASVFVNPLQFGPGEDYEAYPRNLQRDVAFCEERGVDVVFHPSVDEMYGKDFSTYVVMETLVDALCGKSRPGHFRGVCTVVNKLFNIVDPDLAFFGQKDAQQLAIIKRMVADLNMRVEVIGCPIIREEDGLAKSSRNAYLSPDERLSALVLSRALHEAERLICSGERDSATVAERMKTLIQSEPKASLDYLEIVDMKNMRHIETIVDGTLVALAVYIGTTRLIDNFLYEGSE